MLLQNFLFIFSIAFQSHLALAQPTSMILKNTQQEFKLFKKEQWHVSESCLQKSCLALKAPKAAKKSLKDAPLTGQPSAVFCVQSGGSYHIAAHPAGDEDGICVFPDKSFILGWDYFHKNNKPK